MSILPVAEPGSSQRRDEVLRELNLYPLWQRRMPANADTGAAGVSAPVALEVAGSKPEPAAADTSHLNWAELRTQVKACAACSLRAGSTQTVFGTGDENAGWLFVGSWPSEDDDAQGEPFAGQAGQLLDNMLAAIQLKRGVNVYLANIVKCTGSIRRAPQADQIAQCASYLTRQIQLLQPKVIVALGHAAATALLGEDREWSSLLGTVHEYRCMENIHTRRPIPLVITHHPAALLLAPLNKAQTWRDLCLARDTMRGEIL